jgi:ribosomal protein S18 acetylase RimI-like enzyme
MDLSFEEDFLDRFVRRPSYDPTLWFLAVDGSDVVGAISAEQTPSMGWIRQLSVLPSHRGMGIGTSLLQETYCAFHAREVRRVRLGVDADNKSGAVNLYKRVGMHVACEYRCYDKDLESA